jgi:hypothetical protein
VTQTQHLAQIRAFTISGNGAHTISPGGVANWQPTLGSTPHGPCASFEPPVKNPAKDDPQGGGSSFLNLRQRLGQAPCRPARPASGRTPCRDTRLFNQGLTAPRPNAKNHPAKPSLMIRRLDIHDACCRHVNIPRSPAFSARQVIPISTLICDLRDMPL